MKKNKEFDVKQRKRNIIVAIGVIICSVMLLLTGANEIEIFVSGLVIGMHIMLIVDEITKLKKLKKQESMDYYEN